MIRQILRNIQYSLLLSALLFVFLAFFHPVFITNDIDAFSKWWEWDYNDQPYFFTSPSSLYASSSTTASISSSSSNAAKELRGSSSSSSGEVKTVSYMVAIPPPSSMSMEDCKRQDKIWMDRGAVLQTSIQWAHKGTRYRYRIYALQQQHQQQEEEESGLSYCTESNVATILSSLGYDILKVGGSAWSSSSSGVQKGDVIVHLSLDSILLRPLHHLFDALLLDQQWRMDIFFPPSDASAVSQEAKVLNSFFVFRSSHKLLLEEYVRWISHSSNRWNDDAGNTNIGNGIDISAKTFFEDPRTERYSRNIRVVQLHPCAYYHTHNTNHVRSDDAASSYDKRSVTETTTINHDPTKRLDQTVSLNEDCDISNVLVATFATTTTVNEKEYKNEHPIGTSTCPMPWRCPQQQSSLLLTNNDAPQKVGLPTKPVSKLCNNLHQSWLSMHKRRFTTTTTKQKKAGSSDGRINNVNMNTDHMENDSLDYDCSGFETKA